MNDQIPLITGGSESSGGYGESRCVRYARPPIATAAFSGGAGAIIFVYAIREIRDSSLLRTICSTGSGALLQLSAELAFSRPSLSTFRKIAMHYSPDVLLGLWQLYLNLPDQTSRQAILDLLCALGGVAITMKLNRIFCTTVAEAQDPTRVYGEDRHLTLAGYPTTVCGETLWQLFPLIAGVLLVVWGDHLSQDEILELLGYLLIGLPIGSICSSLWEKLSFCLENKHAASLKGNPTILPPLSLRVVRTTGSLSNAFGPSLCGALIVPSGPPFMLGVGAVLGAIHHFARKHFEQLRSINRAPPPSSCREWSFRLVDGGLCLGALGFIIWQMVEGTLIDQTSLGSFVLGGLGGFGLVKCLQGKFDPQNQSRPLNTVQFLTTEFAVWQLILFFLVTKVQNISDRGLQSASLTDAILSGVAYADLGGAVGTDQAVNLARRADFSAFSLVFIGRLVAERVAGRLE